LDVGDQVRGGVVDDLAQGNRAAGAALIEDDDAVEVGVEKPPMGRIAAGTGTAMKKDHWNAGGVAGFLPVHLVAPVELEHAVPGRFDFRVDLAACHEASKPGAAPRLYRGSRAWVDGFMKGACRPALP